MNQDDSDRTFLPRNKPKSWVVIIICGLIGVLIAGPFAFLGGVLEIEVLTRVGTLLFWGCWIVAIPLSFVYLFRLSSGYYKDIRDCDWKDQYW